MGNSMIFELEKEEKVKLIIKVNFEFTGSLSRIHKKPVYSGHTVFLETFLEEEGYEKHKLGNTEFKFYGSIEKPKQEKKDIPFMLSCFVSDAIAGSMDFEEFCREFGYCLDHTKVYEEIVEEQKNAEFIHWQCKEYYEEFTNIYGAFKGIDPYILLDYLNGNFEI